MLTEYEEIVAAEKEKEGRAEIEWKINVLSKIRESIDDARMFIICNYSEEDKKAEQLAAESSPFDISTMAGLEVELLNLNCFLTQNIAELNRAK